MYVCLCKNITDKQITEHLDKGVQNLSQLRRKLGVASQCGQCACHAKELVSQHSRDRLSVQRYE